ncbi:MAG: acetate--CoA ligase family protein [Spirochaetota bacterium]
MHSLDSLYKPKSIAVVGASADETKAGYQMVYALRAFPGKLYPINPKADSILSFKAYPDLKSIGNPIDLVILTIPAQRCVDALKEAGEAGAGAALIIGGGFAETGGEGERMQNELVSVCRKYGIRLLGPNTAGFANPRFGVTANFNPWIGDVRQGNIGLISQSGAMSFTLVALIQTQNLGVSLVTGIGNGAVVNVSDVVEYLADDDNTKAIVLYLEGVKEGRRLYDIVKKTAEKKPVLFLTIGKSDISEFASSHTGNLIGSYRLKIAALIQAGAVMAESSDDIIDAADLLSRVRIQPKENPGVGLLTGQAGPGLVIADYLRSKGVLIPELQPSTIEKIKKELPPISFIRNPVDTTRPGDTFPNVMRAMADDPAIDILSVFALHEPAIIDPVSLFKQFKDIKQPLILGTGGFPEHIHPTQKALAENNIPSFPSPDRTAKAIRALVDDSKAAYRKSRRADVATDKIDIAPLTEIPDEAEALDILDRTGITTPQRIICASHDKAKKAFAKLGKPCVVKVLDKTIKHKTEVGGVILGVKTEKQLEAALKQIDKIKTGSKKKYLIEETAKPGLEIIIGAINDASFGPAVLLGLGGVTAEALDDVSMRLAPLTQFDAEEMISELKGKALFNGWRGSPAVDKRRIAEALVRIGLLMTGHPEIKEMDLNPVRVYEDGLIALDALIVLK